MLQIYMQLINRTSAYFVQNHNTSVQLCTQHNVNKVRTFLEQLVHFVALDGDVCHRVAGGGGGGGGVTEEETAH